MIPLSIYFVEHALPVEVSHRIPVNPIGHWQETPPPETARHEAPFKHGLELHGFAVLGTLPTKRKCHEFLSIINTINITCRKFAIRSIETSTTQAYISTALDINTSSLIITRIILTGIIDDLS